jgi:hypothetical protein
MLLRLVLRYHLELTGWRSCLYWQRCIVFLFFRFRAPKGDRQRGDETPQGVWIKRVSDCLFQTTFYFSRTELNLTYRRFPCKPHPLADVLIFIRMRRRVQYPISTKKAMKCAHSAKAEFLLGVLVKIKVYWDMTPCQLVSNYPSTQDTLTHSYYNDGPRAGRTLDQLWGLRVYPNHFSGVIWPEYESPLSGAEFMDSWSYTAICHVVLVTLTFTKCNNGGFSFRWQARKLFWRKM